MDEDDFPPHVESTDTVDYRSALAPATRMTLGKLFEQYGAAVGELDLDEWAIIDPDCVVYVLPSGEVLTVLSLNNGDAASMRLVRAAIAFSEQHNEAICASIHDAMIRVQQEINRLCTDFAFQLREVRSIQLDPNKHSYSKEVIGKDGQLLGSVSVRRNSEGAFVITTREREK